jgi:transposase InsO family protein
MLDDPCADIALCPQSNGKIRSWHKTLKRERIRPETPLNVADARRIVGREVSEYTDAYTAGSAT